MSELLVPPYRPRPSRNMAGGSRSLPQSRRSPAERIQSAIPRPRRAVGPARLFGRMGRGFILGSGFLSRRRGYETGRIDDRERSGGIAVDRGLNVAGSARRLLADLGIDGVEYILRNHASKSGKLRSSLSGVSGFAAPTASVKVGSLAETSGPSTSVHRPPSPHHPPDPIHWPPPPSRPSDRVHRPPSPHHPPDPIHWPPPPSRPSDLVYRPPCRIVLRTGFTVGLCGLGC